MSLMIVLILLTLTVWSFDKICINIVTRSANDCKTFLNNNKNKIGMKENLYVNCILDERDEYDGCHDLKSNNLMCRGISGIHQYNNLPEKQMKSLSLMDDDCKWCFSFHYNTILKESIEEVLGVVKNRDCKRKCYFGNLHKGELQDKKNILRFDKVLSEKYGTNNFPPYMDSCGFGFSGDITKLIKFLKRKKWYHFNGNSDVYFGMLMTAINATFVDIGNLCNNVNYSEWSKYYDG